MRKLSLDPRTTSHIIILKLFFCFDLVLGCYYKKLKYIVKYKIKINAYKCH
jgi:hypothetical protein